MECMLLSEQHMNSNIESWNPGSLSRCRKDFGNPCHYLRNIWMRPEIGNLLFPGFIEDILEYVPLSEQCLNKPL